MMRLLPLLFLVLVIVSCRPATYTPKPRGYYKIDFPAERSYRLFDAPGFPYSFQYPEYASIIKDTTFFGKKPDNPYWITIDFPSLGGKIYISYRPIEKNIGQLTEDTYEMTYFHTKKANSIGDFIINRDSARVYGIFYDVSGNAASAYQFFVTDSTKHYLRGALYFDASPNADSLKPLNEFIKTDIRYLIYTLHWKS